MIGYGRLFKFVEVSVAVVILVLAGVARRPEKPREMIPIYISPYRVNYRTVQAPITVAVRGINRSCLPVKDQPAKPVVGEHDSGQKGRTMAAAEIGVVLRV